jgi:hypothetical protein
LKSETLDLDERFGKEYAGHYVFSEITWAKRNRIIQLYTKYSRFTGQVESSDFVAIQAETIMASLREQPQNKPITLEKLLSEDSENGIPIDLGELLSKVVNKLCNVSKEDSAFLLEQSEDKSQTKPSQSFGYAKSSGGPPTSSQDNQQKPSSNSL